MEKFLFVCMFACLLVSVGLRARIAGQNVRVSMAEQLLTPSQQVTGSIPENDMFFFPPHARSCNIRACASAASIFCILHALQDQLLGHGDAVLQKLSMRYRW